MMKTHILVMHNESLCYQN